MKEHSAHQLRDCTEFAFADALADVDGDLEVFEELVSLYEEELPVQTALLCSAASDVSQLVRLLHEAANTLATLGARLDASRVREVQQRLRGGDVSQLAIAATEACAAMRRTGAALRRWVDSRST